MGYVWCRKAQRILVPGDARNTRSHTCWGSKNSSKAFGSSPVTTCAAVNHQSHIKVVVRSTKDMNTLWTIPRSVFQCAVIPSEANSHSNVSITCAQLHHFQRLRRLKPNHYAAWRSLPCAHSMPLSPQGSLLRTLKEAGWIFPVSLAMALTCLLTYEWREIRSTLTETLPLTLKIQGGVASMSSCHSSAIWLFHHPPGPSPWQTTSTLSDCVGAKSPGK